MDSQEVLSFQNVKKSFLFGKEKIEVLKDIDLCLKSSQFISLIGPSGSGKTTLIQLAGLLDIPTEGKICIHKIDVSSANDQQRTLFRRDYIGFIFQFHHLLPEFSALENIALPLLIRGYKRDSALDEANETLKKLSLKDKSNFRPAQLSGGQQQRVAIGRAIISKPTLILADEPTGNLDASMSLVVFDLLHDLVKSLNIACLVVTHNLELAKRTDSIIAIKEGKLLKV